LKNTHLSRRLFLSGIAVGSASLFLSACSKDKIIVYANSKQVLLQAAYHLYPTSSIGFGAKDLHIASYINFVLEDERIIKSDRDYFLKGATWLEESAFEEYDKSFLNLSKDEKEDLFENITQKRWGENFVYNTLTYIFEAMISAPIYGSNIDEIGWKWLDHNPGFPQPQTIKEITYEV